MAIEKELKTRIQLKYDSLANWNSNGSVVLKAGEIGICAIPSGSSAVNGDNARPQILFKVGDGTSTFANLPWASAKAADVYDWAKQSTLPIVRASSETGDAGNVIASIAWNATTNKLEYTTASVATSAGMKQVADDLDALEAAVAAMYTNAQIDSMVADAKQAGIDANSALEAYKTANDAAVADAKKAGTDASAALEAYKTSNGQVIDGINANIEDIIDGTTPVAEALHATKATQDANGKDIAATYETKADASAYQTANDARVKSVEDSIAAINNAESGILADAKAYADAKDEAMDARVDVLEAIDHSVYAKSADVVANTTFEAFQTNNTAAIEAAEKAAKDYAKDYADEIKENILGEGITETYDTLVEIQSWIEGAGVNATELTEAIAAEAKIREESDKTLQANIEAEATNRASDVSALGIRIDNVVNGTTPVAEATHATKATQDGNGKVIADTYETKADASAKLTEAKNHSNANLATAKTYTDNAVSGLQTTLEAADEALDGRVDALEEAFSSGIANEAAKVSNALTVNMEDGSKVEFDGSKAQTIDLTNLATKSYADQAEADALSAAKSYTNDEIAKLDTAYKAADEALDSRVETIENSYLTDVTVGTGLKVSNSPDVHGRLVEIDESVVFVFNCGTSSTLVD